MQNDQWDGCGVAGYQSLQRPGGIRRAHPCHPQPPVPVGPSAPESPRGAPKVLTPLMQPRAQERVGGEAQV